MSTRYDPQTGHADYPHLPGTLYDCKACEDLMDEEEAQMDAETLKKMAEVYVTDDACKAAVERLRASEGLSFVEAAQQAAKTVAPGLTSFAAQDARYLLAPEIQDADEARLTAELREQFHFQGGRPQDAETYEAEAQRYREERDEIPDVAPLPAHRDEALDDRVSFTFSQTFPYAGLLSEGDSGPIIRDHECGLICKMVDDFNADLNERFPGRIPVQPPEIKVISDEREFTTVEISAELIPARGRWAATIIARSYDPAIREEGVRSFISRHENDFSLNVRHHNPGAPEWVSIVAYRPDVEMCECGTHPVGQPRIMSLDADELPPELQLFLALMTATGAGSVTLTPDGGGLAFTQLQVDSIRNVLGD